MTNLQVVAFHNSQEQDGVDADRKEEVVEGTWNAHDGDDRSGEYFRKKVPMLHNLNANDSSESRCCLDCSILGDEDERRRRYLYR